MGPVMWTPGMSLDAMEGLIIRRAYDFYKNNKTQTANSLGISIRTLDAKLERYQKEDEDFAASVAEAKSQREAFNLRQRGIPGGAQHSTPETAGRFDAAHKKALEERVTHEIPYVRPEIKPEPKAASRKAR